MKFFDYLLKWDHIPKSAEGAIIFDASEIALELDKVYRPNPESSSYPREAYGVCAPPFRDRYFWIEATTQINPENYESPGDIADMTDLGYSPEEVLSVSRGYRDYYVSRGVLCMARDYRDSETGRQYREFGEDYDSGRWILEIYGFTTAYKPGQLSQGNLIPIPARALVVIGRDGTLLSDPEETVIEGFGEDHELREI